MYVCINFTFVCCYLKHILEVTETTKHREEAYKKIKKQI